MLTAPLYDPAAKEDVVTLTEIFWFVVSEPLGLIDSHTGPLPDTVARAVNRVDRVAVTWSACAAGDPLPLVAAKVILVGATVRPGLGLSSAYVANAAKVKRG